MASLAPYVCACGKAVPSGTRCSCKAASDRARKARFDQQRPTARQRGYNGKWDKARATFLARHPRCARCNEAARIVDHVIPHKGDPKLFWDSGNWQPLCTSCHSGAKQREERR